MMSIFIVDGLDAFILDTNIGIKPLDYLWKKLWKKANARALLILDLNTLANANAIVLQNRTAAEGWEALEESYGGRASVVKDEAA